MDPQLQQNLGQLGGLILTPIGVGKLGSAFSKIRAGRRAAQAAREGEQSAAEGGESASGAGEGASGAGAGGEGAGASGAGAGGEGAGGAGAGEGAGGAGASEGGADFEVAADTDLALGGPENPVADIAAGVVALGLGIFSVFEGSNTSKPKSPPPPPPPENVTLQSGISAAEV